MFFFSLGALKRPSLQKEQWAETNPSNICMDICFYRLMVLRWWLVLLNTYVPWENMDVRWVGFHPPQKRVSKFNPEKCYEIIPLRTVGAKAFHRHDISIAVSLVLTYLTSRVMFNMDLTPSSMVATHLGSILLLALDLKHFFLFWWNGKLAKRPSTKLPAAIRKKKGKKTF